MNKPREDVFKIFDYTRRRLAFLAVALITVTVVGIYISGVSTSPPKEFKLSAVDTEQ